MATRTVLSDHCILHAADVEGGTPRGSRPPISAKVLATLPLLLVDRKQHFTGIRGAAWRMFGVDRSPKNPNVCNIWDFHWETGRLSTITALFADCRGFTSLVSERGPEVVAPLMDEFFRQCRDIIASNDGILDKVMGDAVFALFNVPITRDDHVYRAVTTAERIRETAPLIGAVDGENGPLRVGVGVSTGVAYTATAGSDDCRDYTVIGDVVNVAARLQAQAKPGEILVTEQVYGEVTDSFPDADMQTMELKGIPEPVRAYSIP